MIQLFSRRLCSFILFVVVALMGTGCTTRADLDQNLTDDREVFIRLSNSTEYRIKTSIIGHQYIKPNSYSRTTYHTRYGSLRAGEVTNYKQVPNVTIGYQVLRFEDIEFIDEEISYLMIRPLDYLDPTHISDVQWTHPYSNKIMVEQGLAAGSYTIELTSIIRDSDGREDVSATMIKDK